MARRLYLGRLPTDARAEEVQKLFDGYGRIIDCRVMTGFGFVEFENNRDAEDAVQQFNGKSFMGNNIVVEFAKESRPRREPYDDHDRDRGGYPQPRSRRPPGIRVLVSGISRDTSWQDLKDFGREAGSVSFADIDRDVPGQGILEYLSQDDADTALKVLSGKELRGQPVDVLPAPRDTREPDDFRRSDRDRYPPPRERDDRRDDRDRYARDRYSGRDEYTRRRSRSPAPRSSRDARSPPPPRDDRDRPPYESRRDDRRPRDDYDRPPRNGDGGWTRP